MKIEDFAPNCLNCVHLIWRSTYTYCDAESNENPRHIFFWNVLDHKKLESEGRLQAMFCRYFEKKDTICYITTALCNILNFPDNCIYLETLRNFRDNILKTNEIYKELLNQYDTIGPLISKNLLKDENNNIIAGNILNNYIIPICKCINEYEHNDAISKYKNMVFYLCDKYKISANNPYN